MNAGTVAIDAASTLRITTDRDALDVEWVHRMLSAHSTWARGIPFETVQRSITHSLCFGGFIGNAQVAFARVITDRATFANLVDVFVLPERRGEGIGKALMHAVMTHPDLQGLRRFTLATADAHGLYAAYGFTAPAQPQMLMERYVPDLYAAGASRPVTRDATS